MKKILVLLTVVAIVFCSFSCKTSESAATEPAPAETTAPAEAAPAPEQTGGSPEEQLMMACQQALETQDCNLAMQVCQAIMQMIGGGAHQEAPAAPEGQEPVYRKGGRLVRFQKKF